ncbi:MAG: VWA containing CoxE family protein [Dysosmobacter sp.]|nr:VWA containing CoxE family protein [Dysosmobacter sp.]
MFLTFFYLLRASGINVSLSEWLTLMEGLRMDLHDSTLSGFYTLCRSVLLHSEADFDRFDQVFLEFFKDVKHVDEVPPEMLKWLEHPELDLVELERLSEITGLSVEEIEKMFAERLKGQDAEHNGGRKWVGTGGFTPFGHRGKKLGGIRVGGKSNYRSAYRVAGERKYRDWRKDNTIDSRQFQMAFRSLRQLSSNSDEPKTELDIDTTIRKTCDNAGNLSIEFTRPRKNALKLMLLMDSGGSMDYYRELCSLLFQSVSKAGRFKDLKVYYFHNAPGKRLYLDPTLDWRNSVLTEWVMNNIPSDYKVIIVGDASMSMQELLPSYNWWKSDVPENSGLALLLALKRRYPHLIWLHPQPRPAYSSYWTQTFELLEKHFDMYQLSIDGMTKGMKKLMVRR